MTTIIQLNGEDYSIDGAECHGKILLKNGKPTTVAEFQQILPALEGIVQTQGDKNNVKELYRQVLTYLNETTNARKEKHNKNIEEIKHKMQIKRRNNENRLVCKLTCGCVDKVDQSLQQSKLNKLKEGHKKKEQRIRIAINKEQNNVNIFNRMR